MGNTVSQTVVQDYTVLLSKFSDASRINSDDPYWRQLFAFPMPLSQLDPKLVEQVITGCCSSLGEILKKRLQDAYLWMFVPAALEEQSGPFQHSICMQSATMEVPRTCKSCFIICSEQLLQAKSMKRSLFQQPMLFT